MIKEYQQDIYTFIQRNDFSKKKTKEAVSQIGYRTFLFGHCISKLSAQGDKNCS